MVEISMARQLPSVTDIKKMHAVSIKHSNNALQTQTPCVRGLPGTVLAPWDCFDSSFQRPTSRPVWIRAVHSSRTRILFPRSLPHLNLSIAHKGLSGAVWEYRRRRKQNSLLDCEVTIYYHFHSGRPSRPTPVPSVTLYSTSHLQCRRLYSISTNPLA